MTALEEQDRVLCIHGALRSYQLTLGVFALFIAPKALACTRLVLIKYLLND